MAKAVAAALLCLKRTIISENKVFEIAFPCEGRGTALAVDE